MKWSIVVQQTEYKKERSKSANITTAVFANLAKIVNFTTPKRSVVNISRMDFADKENVKKGIPSIVGFTPTNQKDAEEVTGIRTYMSNIQDSLARKRTECMKKKIMRRRLTLVTNALLRVITTVV